MAKTGLAAQEAIHSRLERAELKRHPIELHEADEDEDQADGGPDQPPGRAGERDPREEGRPRERNDKAGEDEEEGGAKGEGGSIAERYRRATALGFGTGRSCEDGEEEWEGTG